MYSDPRVMATLGGLRSEAATRNFLEAGLLHWAEHGFGLWVLFDAADGSFLGRAGLRHVHVGGGDEVELLYALMPGSWNRGLATEASRALLRIAFETLGLEDVVSFTLPMNVASRRVMEKSGFRYERDIVYAELPHVLYRITAEQYRAARAEEGEP
jgi:RimJ/RimL family protein N-acetyltransferase